MEATAPTSELGLSPRYRPALSVLHWLLALLVMGMLGVGFLALAPLADTDPGKVSILRWHMLGGILTLGTLILLAVLRWTMGAPTRLKTGRGGLDVLSIVVHRGFYLVLLLMASSGIATSVLAGLPSIVFGRSDAPRLAERLAEPEGTCCPGPPS